MAGSNQSGKRTLVRRLLNKAQSAPVAAADLALSYEFQAFYDDEGPARILSQLLRYSHIQKQMERADLTLQMGAFILSDQEAYQPLLRQLLTPALHQNTVIVIVLDGARPYALMEQLCGWLAQVKAVVDQWPETARLARQDAGMHYI